MDKPLLKTAAELAAFRQLDTAAQLAQLRGLKVERIFTVQRDTINEEKRTVWVAASSELPYERWWGTEILDHGQKSIRTDRLRSGMAVLIGHDTANHVGVVDDFEIATDRKLRTLTRFGKSALSAEKFRDVLDGILVNVSIGYIIHDLVLEKSEEGVNTYRVTDWEPYEVSFVAVPADPTVGVGRELDPPAPSTQRTSEMTPEEKAKIEAEVRAKVEAEVRAKAEVEAKAKAEAEARAANTPEAIAKRETERVNAILTVGDEFKDQGGPELARELVKDSTATVETFKARMFEKFRGKQKPTQTAAPADRPVVYGQGIRNIIYSGKLRGFRDLEFEDGSKMPAMECAYRSGMWALAVIYGNQRAQQFCRDHGLEGHLVARRDLTESVNSAGGFLVPAEMETAIIDLRLQYGVARRLARFRPMNSMTSHRPRRTGGVTAYFVGETGGATASDKAWDQVVLSAKLLNALTKLSTSVVEDAVIDLAMDVAGEQAYAFANKEDLCFFTGDGTSTYGGMRGINALIETNVATWKAAVVAAANHDTWSEIDNADLTAVIGALPSYARVGARWAVSPLGEASVFGRLKAVAGGNTINTLQGGVVESDYLGYPVTLAEAMPSGTATTDYSNKVMALFGNFSMAVDFGERRGITMQVLRELYAANNEIGILSTERFDINAHDLGDATNAGPLVALVGQ